VNDPIAKPFVAAAVLLLAASCGPGAPAADVAAEVGDRRVPYAEFEAYLAANAIADAPSLDSRVLSRLLDQFLDELLLRRLAEEEGMPGGASRAGVAELVAQASQAVEHAEIDQFYNAHRERFRQPERVRVRQILVEDRGTAELAARELDAGVPFEEVARKLSQGPRAKLGGDQGVLGREDLPPEIADRIFGLAAEEVSDIVAADYGFHIFQVSERLPPSDMPVEAVEPAILDELRDRKRGEAIAALRERAAKRYNASVYSRNLPFRYEGRYQGNNG
jgi:parvulin-like peptidyl-prolyl isomerase